MWWATIQYSRMTEESAKEALRINKNCIHVLSNWSIATKRAGTDKKDVVWGALSRNSGMFWYQPEQPLVRPCVLPLEPSLLTMYCHQARVCAAFGKVQRLIQTMKHVLRSCIQHTSMLFQKTSSLNGSGSDKLMGYTLGMLKSAAQKVAFGRRQGCQEFYGYVSWSSLHYFALDMLKLSNFWWLQGHSPELPFFVDLLNVFCKFGLSQARSWICMVSRISGSRTCNHSCVPCAFLLYMFMPVLSKSIGDPLLCKMACSKSWCYSKAF